MPLLFTRIITVILTLSFSLFFCTDGVLLPLVLQPFVVGRNLFLDFSENGNAFSSTALMVCAPHRGSKESVKSDGTISIHFDASFRPLLRAPECSVQLVQTNGGGQPQPSEDIFEIAKPISYKWKTKRVSTMAAN
uniref:Putative secreted protein n=1 Tax=Anopheles darlingi TaxID=43151 RepID=A0A2M4DNF3_ANODA